MGNRSGDGAGGEMVSPFLSVRIQNDSEDDEDTLGGLQGANWTQAPSSRAGQLNNCTDTPGVGILYFASCAQSNRVQPLHSQHQTHPLAFVTQHAPHCLQDTAATPASPMRLAWLRAPERIPCSRSKRSISGVSGVSQSHAPPFTHGSCYRTGVLSLCACRHQQGCTHEGVPCRGSTADVVWVHDAAPALNYGAAGPPAASAQLRHV